MIINNAKRKRIGLNALGLSTWWTGGIYYIRNIAFQLCMNSQITNRYDIYLFVYEKNRKEYMDLPEEIKIITVSKNQVNKLYMLYLFKSNRMDFVYPMGRRLDYLGIESIAWIADFQHNYYPEMFKQQEVLDRTRLYQKFADKNKSVVLSSCSCRDDFEKFYKPSCENVQVLRFVSYIEPMIKSMGEEQEDAVLVKYGLSGRKYVCIMNQFWQHKNHMVVLRALEVFFQKKPNDKTLFVFTGKLEDYRNPEYIDKLKTIFDNENIKKHVLLIGFIDRKEQITIMKNSEYIIQPSIFEGWGTVVEDGKVLDKTILLSDIPVHREQKSRKCILFKPHDYESLAKLIEEENLKVHKDDIEFGISDMRDRARNYSKAFEELLDNLERK